MTHIQLEQNDTVGRRSWKNPTCTNPFPNPESRGRKKKMTHIQLELEEPHLHEPVSKSGKPREEKKNDTHTVGAEFEQKGHT
jgi:hypothetical protein